MYRPSQWRRLAAALAAVAVAWATPARSSDCDYDALIERVEEGSDPAEDVLVDAGRCEQRVRKTFLQRAGAKLDARAVSAAVTRLFESGESDSTRWALEILIHMPPGHEFRLAGPEHFATLLDSDSLPRLIARWTKSRSSDAPRILESLFAVARVTGGTDALDAELLKAAQRVQLSSLVRAGAVRALEGSRLSGIDRRLLTLFVQEPRLQAAIAQALRGKVTRSVFHKLAAKFEEDHRERWNAADVSERCDMLHLAASLDGDGGLDYIRDRAIYGRELEERVLAVELFAAYAASPRFIGTIREVQLLQVEDYNVRIQMWMKLLDGLARAGGEEAAALLVKATEHPELRVRLAAARLIGSLPHERTIPIWKRLLGDSAPQVVIAAIWGLFSTRRVEALAALLDGLPIIGKAGRVALADAFRVLRRWTGAEIEDDPGAWEAWRRERGDGLPRSGPSAARDTPRRGTVVAKFFEHEIDSKHPLFLVDVSGSMSGTMGFFTRVERLYVELRDALRSLDADAEFGLIAFSDKALVLAGGPRPPTPENVDLAMAFVKSRRPGRGTNYQAALEAALATEGYDTIYFLSDGEPSTGELQTADAICDWFAAKGADRRLVVNTVGIGGRDEVLRQLSLRNHGVHRTLR